MMGWKQLEKSCLGQIHDLLILKQAPIDPSPLVRFYFKSQVLFKFEAKRFQKTTFVKKKWTYFCNEMSVKYTA